MSDFTKHLREIAKRLHSLPYMEDAVNFAAKEIECLSADLLDERDRVAAMRAEWGAEVAALDAKIDALRSDRDCEKQLRKDAEDALEDAMEHIAGLTSQARHAEDVIAKAVENEAEKAALFARARHAEDCLDAAKARIAELEARK